MRITAQDREFRHTPFMIMLRVLGIIPDLSKRSILKVHKLMTDARARGDIEPWKEKGLYVLSEEALQRGRDENYELASQVKKNQSRDNDCSLMAR